jgi:hypothetical protein
MLHRLAGWFLLTSSVAACSASSSNGSQSPFATTGGSTGLGGAAGAAASNAGNRGYAAGVNGSPDPSMPDLGPIKEQDAASAMCNAIVNKGEQITVDIFFMFDQSASMTCAIPSGGDRWEAVKNALVKFVQDPGAAGINVGIQYFGLQGGGNRRGGGQSSCTPADYQAPDVEIAPLPMNAQPVVDSLNRHMAASNTPTPPALAGAINHAIDWKNQHPGHTVVVVLVTDGQPNQCGAVADVANVAGQGQMHTIPTYVIGVISPGNTCDLDPNPPNQPDLDSVAMAGGTQMALMVDTTQDTAAQFLDTMNKIRAKTVVPCQYSIPPAPAGQQIDPNKINVEYTPPGATMPSTIPGVTMATCDPQSGGWYYDNPGAPTKINLCPATCSAISGQIGGQVNITVGCATKHTR